MNAEPHPISVEEVRVLFPTAPARLYEDATASDPLLIWLYNSTPMCLTGLYPLAPGVAYLWGWEHRLEPRHHIIYARCSRRLIRDSLQRYPVIIGHCRHQSAKWLRSLGATLGPFSADALTFSIKAPLCSLQQ